MKINWFTVIAQVLNFLLLVWLLKRYLYKPILDAIEERENKIVAQLKDAEDKKTDATKEKEDFRKKNEQFDLEKKELMEKVMTESKSERQRFLEEARKEAVSLRANLEKAVQETQANLNQEVMKKTQNEVFAIARKTLQDLASVRLEEQSTLVFIKRLNELGEEDKKQFMDAFKSNSNPILVRSAFDLPQKQREDIQKAVHDLLQTDTPFQFDTTPELIGGIELTGDGYKLAWSISEYLKSLEKSVAETLKEKPEVIEATPEKA